MPINDLTTVQKYNTIVVSNMPMGRYLEGILAAGNAPKPGQFVSQTSDGEYELWNGAADGERDNLLIVLECKLLGRTLDTAYSAGERVFLYSPLRGDLLLAMYGNASGTADDVAVGDKLIIDDGTGKLVPTTGSPEMEPFKAEEAYTDPTADKLILVRCIA